MKERRQKRLKRIAEILYEIMWVDESTNDYGFILPEDKRHHINHEMSANIESTHSAYCLRMKTRGSNMTRNKKKTDQSY